MARESIESLETEKLLKRKKFVRFLAGVFMGAGLILLLLIIYDLVKDNSISGSSFIVFIPCLGGIWITLLMLGNINRALRRRKNAEG